MDTKRLHLKELVVSVPLLKLADVLKFLGRHAVTSEVISSQLGILQPETTPTATIRSEKIVVSSKKVTTKSTKSKHRAHQISSSSTPRAFILTTAETEPRAADEQESDLDAIHLVYGNDESSGMSTQQVKKKYMLPSPGARSAAESPLNVLEKENIQVFPPGALLSKVDTGIQSSQPLPPPLRRGLPTLVTDPPLAVGEFYFRAHEGFGLTVVRFAEDGNLQTLDRAMYEELQRMALEESAAEDTPNPHQ